jgi:hypothetical protein
MRRSLSISLILLLWLGPFAAVLSGSSESRLPFCCRSHGAHHCAMDDEAAQNTGSGPVLRAHSRCPQFPATLATTATQKFLAAARLANGTDIIVGMLSPAARRDSARAGLLRTAADRGPPFAVIA